MPAKGSLAADEEAALEILRQAITAGEGSYTEQRIDNAISMRMENSNKDEKIVKINNYLDGKSFSVTHGWIHENEGVFSVSVKGRAAEEAYKAKKYKSPTKERANYDTLLARTWRAIQNNPVAVVCSLLGSAIAAISGCVFQIWPLIPDYTQRAVVAPFYDLIDIVQIAGAHEPNSQRSRVYASEARKSTIILRNGQRYSISVEPTGGKHPSPEVGDPPLDPDHMAEMPVGALIGSIGLHPNYFLIGKGIPDFKARGTGFLYLYIQDGPSDWRYNLPVFKGNDGWFDVVVTTLQ